jgi:hypothetical protein
MDQAAADDLIADALTNAAVATLYRSVDALSPITVEPSNGNTWSSRTMGAGTVISVALTRYPAESLYHELLHAHLKVKGYRQHVIYVRVTDNNSAQALADALDNELQHHRMFPAFVAAGFDAENFYHDGDDATFATIRTALKRLKPADTHAATYFLKYLSIIAPGGRGGEDERAQLDRFFRMKVPADKLLLVEEAAAKVRAWGTATDADPGPLTVGIIAGLGDFGGWWIGASQNFPADGHFTGAAFTFDDAQRFWASKGASR